MLSFWLSKCGWKENQPCITSTNRAYDRDWLHPCLCQIMVTKIHPIPTSQNDGLIFDLQHSWYFFHLWSVYNDIGIAVLLPLWRQWCRGGRHKLRSRKISSPYRTDPYITEMRTATCTINITNHMEKHHWDVSDNKLRSGQAPLKPLYNPHVDLNALWGLVRLLHFVWIGFCLWTSSACWFCIMRLSELETWSAQT